MCTIDNIASLSLHFMADIYEYSGAVHENGDKTDTPDYAFQETCMMDIINYFYNVVMKTEGRDSFFLSLKMGISMRKDLY